MIQFRVADVARAEEVFAAIRRIKGVAEVDLIKPDAKHPLVRSMAFARLDHTIDVVQVCAEVANIEGVQACEVSRLDYGVA